MREQVKAEYWASDRLRAEVGDIEVHARRQHGELKIIIVEPSFRGGLEEAERRLQTLTMAVEVARAIEYSDGIPYPNGVKGMPLSEVVRAVDGLEFPYMKEVS